MKPIESHAFFTDEKHNIGVIFGLMYVGISQLHGESDDGVDNKILEFCELEEPFDPEHPEKARPRTDIPTVSLYFRDKKGIDTVIENLQDLRAKFDEDGSES